MISTILHLQIMINYRIFTKFKLNNIPIKYLKIIINDEMMRTGH